MKNIFFSLLLALALTCSITACGKNPQKRFAELCDSEKDAAKRNSCLCTGQELAKALDKERYEKLVDEMEDAQNTEGTINFAEVIRSDALDQETITAFVSSAKKCGPAR
jgi:predicted small lipoprotein YifL